MKKLLMMIGAAASCVALSMSALADLPSGYRQLDYVYVAKLDLIQ